MADSLPPWSGGRPTGFGASAPPPEGFEITTTPTALACAGDLRMPDANAIWKALAAGSAGVDRGRLDLDLSRARVVDGGIMSLLVQVRDELAARGVACEIKGANERVARLVGLYRGNEKPVRHKRRRPEGVVEQVGRATASSLGEAGLVVEFLGRSLAELVGVLRRPRTGNWGDVVPLLERAGADAVPIVLLINFLVGFVMGYQSANQLRQYGANIFVADLVGLSVTRELAPLMTAIIVCGRSGAAFTAELGSMKVAEEIDALRTIGLGPIRYLVLPRVIALLVVTPILALFGDLIGIAGGLAVGMTSLGLGFTAYLNETLQAVHLHDVVSGLVKSAVFAFAIAVIACQQGFATSGGAEGVGRRTTSTVVTCLFAIVLLDALATVVFRVLDV